MQIFEPEITTQSILEDLGSKTMVDYFFDTVSRYPDRLALRAKTAQDGSDTDKVGEFSIEPDEMGESWRTYSWSQYGDASSRFAKSLEKLGVKADDRVMLLLRNCPAFHICDVGIMIHGAPPVYI